MPKTKAKETEAKQLKTTASTPKSTQDVARAEKVKALELTLSQIERQFGKGAIMKLGGQTKADVPALPTGAVSLDMALGVGGIPRGRIVEIFGPESSGKTTLTLSIIAETQKRGGVAAFIDAEHAFDPTYAKKIGINTEELLISQPDSGEQALEIAEMLVRSNAIDVIVIDSVAALVPKAEIEGEMGQIQVGLQARLMSQALRKLTGATARSKTALIFINQLREKIGVMFGNPETTPGGRALKFYSSVRLDIRRIEHLKRGEEVVGSHVRVRVVKNKVAPPFRQAEFDILFGEGISKSGDIIDLGLLKGILQRTGTWITYGEMKLGQGRENARAYLKENPKLLEELEKVLRQKMAEIEQPAETGKA
ncbi:MAG: recombinase RecA [Candidatus Omnitrophica bacterium]|nr:recombinase RecA [Candidatus Omnitrophota bacterium]